MKYIDLQRKFIQQWIFSIKDLKTIEPNFSKNNLLTRQKKNYLWHLIKGRYYFKDKHFDTKNILQMANRIYEPSYISLEYALNIYNIIPEWVYTYTSITTKKTSSFKTNFWLFNYRHIKPELFFGYKIIKSNQNYYKIADIEKTIIDYIYLNTDKKDFEDFYEMRINIDELKQQRNKKKLLKYAKIIQQKTFQQRLTNFISFTESNDRHYQY